MPARRSRVRAPLPPLLCCLCTFAAAFAPAFGARADDAPTDVHRDASALPSIGAEHVRLHEPSGTELMRVRVELSPEGLRVRDRIDGEDVEVIQDFVGERLWFVDRGRRVAHALPLELDGETVATGVSVAGGFLGTIPCGGGEARTERDGSWRGRPVSVRLCLDGDGEAVAVELVDAEHAIVVRRHGADGVVDELRDIRPIAFAPGHFAPPPRFRAIDARELLYGAPSIAPFDERALRDVVRP